VATLFTASLRITDDNEPVTFTPNVANVSIAKNARRGFVLYSVPIPVEPDFVPLNVTYKLTYLRGVLDSTFELAVAVRVWLCGTRDACVITPLSSRVYRSETHCKRASLSTCRLATVLTPPCTSW
jgi:hypothetical protein